MRKVLLGFGMGAAVLAMSAMMLMAASPDEIVIDVCVNKKAAVAFPHKAHQDMGGPCSTCHHTQPDLEAGGEGEKCSGCHVKPEEEGVPACEQMSMSKNPYHIGCVGCHKKEEKGPTKCNDCHPKAE